MAELGYWIVLLLSSMMYIAWAVVDWQREVRENRTALQGGSRKVGERLLDTCNITLLIVRSHNCR